MALSDEKQHISAQTCLALAGHVSVQELGGEEGGVILRFDTGEMYTVNDTSLAFLRELDGERSIADIADRLIQTFEVDFDPLVDDLLELANGLKDESLLVTIRQ